MNTGIPCKEIIREFSGKLRIVLLIFQMNCGDLEVIPPTVVNTRSNFQFEIQDETCSANCTVAFTNKSENADTFEWHFGDETSPSTVASPTHQYAGPGSYDVTLRAFRGSVEDDTTITVKINAPPSTLKAFTHAATSGNTSSHITTLDNVLTNDISTKIIVVTPVLGVRNSAALGMYYFGNKWKIFTQNISNIQAGEIFNVVVSDPDANAFVHQTSAANLRTGYISTIDHTSTNNHPEARVFVTPVWEKSTDYNTHAIGVVYINNRWEIVNLDQANLPVGLKFNVIVSTDNTQSFVHTSTSSTITVDYTMIDDVKTNNKPEIKIISMLNQGTNDAVFSNPRITGLWYNTSPAKWTVFNENGENMPESTSFNILAIE